MRTISRIQTLFSRIKLFGSAAATNAVLAAAAPAASANADESRRVAPVGRSTYLRVASTLFSFRLLCLTGPGCATFSRCSAA